jgi:hypothetical protein
VLSSMTGRTLWSCYCFFSIKLLLVDAFL